MRSRRTVLSVVAIAVIAAACGAVASRRLMQDAPRYAQVIAVTPMSRQLRTPHEICKTEEVKHVRPQLEARASAGQRGAADSRADDAYTTTEEHCATVFEIETEPLGYEVRYRLDGVEGRVHMDRRPGPRILLRNGRVADST